MVWFVDKPYLESLDLHGYDAKAIAERLQMPLERVRAFVDPARRYMVQSNPHYGWLAGANAAGRPTLAFVGTPRITGGAQAPVNVVSFDPPAHRVEAVRALHPDAATLANWELLVDWLEETTGFMHIGNAPVRAFRHPALWHYAITPFSARLHGIAVGTQAELDEGDLDSTRAWIEKGNFMLYAGNDYFVNHEGRVFSS